MTETAAIDLAALRRVALDQLHTGWAENIPAALVQRARHSRLGRRFLSRTLARRWAPNLFATPAAALGNSATALSWMTWPASRVGVLALDLGALALAAPIRAVVDRMHVLRLKRVLGEPRYQLALAEPGDGDDSSLRDALARDGDLLRLLRGRGLAELHAFAERIHPACAERLRLSLRPGVVPQQWLPRLEHARVERHLASMLESVS